MSAIAGSAPPVTGGPPEVVHSLEPGSRSTVGRTADHPSLRSPQRGAVRRVTQLPRAVVRTPVSVLQPYSQQSPTPTLPKEFQIGLYDPAEADLEHFWNCCSEGFLGERLYVTQSEEPGDPRPRPIGQGHSSVGLRASSYMTCTQRKISLGQHITYTSGAFLTVSLVQHGFYASVNSGPRISRGSAGHRGGTSPDP